jgi:cytochrome oxidase Cu insertion factor (SCO1/SenC/PrrC family)
LQSAKEMRMTSPGKPMAARILMGAAVMAIVASIAVGPPTAGAVEVGDRAPDFTLPSTNGVDISLKDFRGKKWVFLEFYAAAFVPT